MKMSFPMSRFESHWVKKTELEPFFSAALLFCDALCGNKRDSGLHTTVKFGRMTLRTAFDLFILTSNQFVDVMPTWQLFIGTTLLVLVGPNASLLKLSASM
jgi:hypothetical protein